MMKLVAETEVKIRRKATVLMFLLFILLIAISIRFPWVYSYHERGADSFFYHRMANSLVTFHEWTWLLHPLSIWGLYPYSDSPASPFIVAEINSLTGFTMENSILIYDFVYMIMGITAAFLLGLKVKNLLTASIIAITLAFAPKAVDPNIFSLDERVGLLFLLMFVFLLTYFLVVDKYSTSKKLKISSLFIPTLFVMSTTHLISIFFIPFLISLPLIKIANGKMKNVIIVIEPFKPWLTLAVFAILFYSLFALGTLFNIPGFNIDTYKRTAIFEGTDPITIALNIGVSIAGGAGILFIVFGLLGALYLVFKRYHNTFERYFIASSLLITPFLMNRLYIRPFMVFIVSVISAYGALHIYEMVIKTKRINIKKAFAVLFLVALIVSMPFTGYMVHRWNASYESTLTKLPTGMTESSYNAAVWFRSHTTLKDIYVSNSESRGGRIEAYANRIMIPGIYSTDLDNIVFYKLYKNKSELGITYNPHFRYKGPYSNFNKWRSFVIDYGTLMNANSHTGIKILRKYNVSYFLYYTLYGTNYEGYYGHALYNSKFCEETPLSDYTIYQSKSYKFIYLNYMRQSG